LEEFKMADFNKNDYDYKRSNFKRNRNNGKPKYNNRFDNSDGFKKHVRTVNGVGSYRIKSDENIITDSIKSNIENKLPLTEWDIEDIKAFVKNLNIVNDDGKTIIFQKEEEALVYGTYLQRLHPEIRFFKVINCFTQYFGKFFLIEPVVTEYSATKFENPTDYNSANDFALVNPAVLVAIVEVINREKKAEEEKYWAEHPEEYKEYLAKLEAEKAAAEESTGEATTEETATTAEVESPADAN
jgi:hypothetical protein